MPKIASLYATYDNACKTVRDLEEIGIPAERISIVARSTVEAGSAPPGVEEPDETPEGKGAAGGEEIGAMLGGGAGLLAGLGLIAIPGIGPVVAAGWLVSTIVGAGAGAAAGSLVGALAGAGFGEDRARHMAEGVKRGGAFVTVDIDEDREGAVRQIMNIYEPVDPERG